MHRLQRSGLCRRLLKLGPGDPAEITSALRGLTPETVAGIGDWGNSPGAHPYDLVITTDAAYPDIPTSAEFEAL